MWEQRREVEKCSSFRPQQYTNHVFFYLSCFFCTVLFELLGIKIKTHTHTSRHALLKDEAWQQLFDIYIYIYIYIYPCVFSRNVFEPFIDSRKNKRFFLVFKHISIEGVKHFVNFIFWSPWLQNGRHTPIGSRGRCWEHCKGFSLSTFFVRKCCSLSIQWFKHNLLFNCFWFVLFAKHRQELAKTPEASTTTSLILTACWRQRLNNEITLVHLGHWSALRLFFFYRFWLVARLGRLRPFAAEISEDSFSF